MESNGGGRARPFSGIAFRLWLVIVAIVITAFVTVLSRLSPGRAKGEVTAVRRSADCKRVSDELTSIRNVQKGPMLCASTLAPDGEEGKARFVVEADVLDLTAHGAAEESASQFDQSYDVADFPEMKVASDGRPSVESSFGSDETDRVGSLSGYMPMFAPGGEKAIAMLGLDVSAVEKQGRDAARIMHQAKSPRESFTNPTAGMESPDHETREIREIIEAMKELGQVVDGNATVAAQLSELAALPGERGTELNRIVTRYKLAARPADCAELRRPAL